MSEIDIDRIISLGEKSADEVEVYLSRYEDLSLEQREMAVSSVFEHEGTSIYIRVVKDGHIGVSASSDPARAKECLTSALSSAKLSEKVVGWTGLPDKTDIPAGDDPFDPALEITPDAAAAYLARMNAGATAYPDARVVTAGVTLLRGSSVLANSHGVRLERRITGISLGMDAIAGTSTGYDSDASPFLSRINPEKIGEQTAFFASASRGGSAVESKKYDVVFSEQVVDSLILELFSEAVNGKNVLSGKSIYAGRIGDTVAAPALSIRDVPTDPMGEAWRRFDTEGTPTRPFDIISGGVLSGFMYDKKTAAQAGVASTAHALRASNGATTIAPHCLRIIAPTADVLSEPCLYIREVIGAHTANPLTGEFSVEVANAFTAEGGELINPVKKAMISGNIFDILNDSPVISETARTFTGAVVPMMRAGGIQVI